MDKKIKQLWIEALESGDYKQCKHRLRVGDEYCCLGVLCELAIKAKIIPEVESIGILDGTVQYRYNGYTADLPATVVRWAGLNGPDPMISSEEETLAGLNDDGMTFEKIADIIKENL